MKKIAVLCLGGLLLSTPFVLAEEEVKSLPKEITPEEKAKGTIAFMDIYRVLQHPRCLNCHPSGSAPLQNDNRKPHAMNISRASVEAGLECAACHQAENSEAYGVVGGPPGAPNWHLPSKDVPLIFQGRSPSQLCEQLKNPKENGDKTLEELFEHIAYDPLVLWGWAPGGNRTVPPLSHPEFTKQFKIWVELNGPCPDE